MGPPFNRRFPNWEAVAEDGLPLLCTILFGFLGAFFGAVAAAPNDVLAERLEIFSLSLRAKDAILILSGVASLAFFTSALLAMYAKMFSVKDAANDEREKVTAVEFQATKKRFLLHSTIAFNIGAFITPIAEFCLIPSPIVWAVLGIYVASIAFIATQLR